MGKTVTRVVQLVLAVLTVLTVQPRTETQVVQEHIEESIKSRLKCLFYHHLHTKRRKRRKRRKRTTMNITSTSTTTKITTTKMIKEVQRSLQIQTVNRLLIHHLD